MPKAKKTLYSPGYIPRKKLFTCRCPNSSTGFTTKRAITAMCRRFRAERDGAANLDMLVEKAAAYEATSYRGVFHFIRYIEKLKKYNTDFGEAPVRQIPTGTAVRIMSIHKSKGLEFPVVFVAGMGKNFNKQDTRGKTSDRRGSGNREPTIWTARSASRDRRSRKM